ADAFVFSGPCDPKGARSRQRHPLPVDRPRDHPGFPPAIQGDPAAAPISPSPGCRNSRKNPVPPPCRLAHNPLITRLDAHLHRTRTLRARGDPRMGPPTLLLTVPAVAVQNDQRVSVAFVVNGPPRATSR